MGENLLCLYLSCGTLTSYLHQYIHTRLNDIEPIDLELVSVSELGTAARGQPQSLRPSILGTRKQARSDAGNFALEHEQPDILQIFSVPLGPENQQIAMNPSSIRGRAWPRKQ